MSIITQSVKIMQQSLFDVQIYFFMTKIYQQYSITVVKFIKK